MNQDDDYTALVNLLIALVQGQVGKPLAADQVWLNDAQTLAKKLFYHLISLRRLAGGDKLVIDGALAFEFVDHASAKVVTRAAFETYLVFFFIYGHADLALGQFRHSIWRHAGLCDRQKYPATTDEAQQKLTAEKVAIDKLRLIIQTSPYLSTYTSAQAKNILAGDWRGGNPWHALSSFAGFHESYFRNVYGYLCGYSHASYISALQVGQAQTIEDQHNLASMCIGIGCKLMAHFARAYVEVFPSMKPILESAISAQSALARWGFSAADWDAVVVSRQSARSTP